jgi:hypothetical protein
MTTTSAATEAATTAFITTQDALSSSIGLGGYYNLADGLTPAGGNTVAAISNITSTGTDLALAGNGVLFLNGANATTPSAFGSPDSYAVSVAANGAVTLLDENTGNTVNATGVAEIVFNNGAALTPSGMINQVTYIGNSSVAQIDTIFQALLDRQPTGTDLSYFQAQLAQGYTPANIATEVLNSAEFSAKFPALATAAPDNGGPDDAAFVTQLYANLLGRTPAASEVAYYTAALQNSEAGSIVNSSNPVSWSRAQEVVNFAASAESQSDTAGVVINTDLGAYQNNGYAAPGSLNASIAANVSSGGTVNSALINPSTIIDHTDVNGGYQAGGVTVSEASQTILSGEANITLQLSTNFPSANIELAQNDTVNGAAAGGSNVTFASLGGVVNLQGTNNMISAFSADSVLVPNPPAAPLALVVNGFVAGDSIAINFGFQTAATSVILLPTPAAGTTITGAAYSSTSGASANFSDTELVINVGMVTNATAAAVAAAAVAVYAPNTTGGVADAVIFYGQAPSGDTIAYAWAGNSTHQVTAASLFAGIDLVGVAPSQITATSFHTNAGAA